MTMQAALHIETFGRTVLAHNVPADVDPYDLLDLCDNVEREGFDSYRFDNVTNKKALVARLKGKQQRTSPKPIKEEPGVDYAEGIN